MATSPGTSDSPSDEKITVSLGDKGGTKTFKDLKGLSEWLTEEQKYWIWWAQEPPSPEKHNLNRAFSGFIAQINTYLREVDGIKSRANQNKQTPDLRNHLTAIRDSFREYYENKKGIYSGTPRAKFIEQLRTEQNFNVACVAACYFMRLPSSFGGFDGIRGAIAAYNFENGLGVNHAKSEKKVLEDMRLEWQDTFQNFATSLEVETGKHTKLNADALTLLSNQDQEFKSKFAQQGKEHGEQFQKHEQALSNLVQSSKLDWKALKETYDADLAIRAPVVYWREKASSHRLLSWIFGGLSVIAVVATFFLIYFEVTELLVRPDYVKATERWYPEYWRLITLLASALLAVWVIRLVVRLFLSNVHLHIDAKERVIMVQTYLALLRRKKVTQDDERMILQALFRPTSTGIVKDDGVPLTVVDLATRLGNRTST